MCRHEVYALSESTMGASISRNHSMPVINLETKRQSEYFMLRSKEQNSMHKHNEFCLHHQMTKTGKKAVEI